MTEAGARGPRAGYSPISAMSLMALLILAADCAAPARSGAKPAKSAPQPTQPPAKSAPPTSAQPPASEPATPRPPSLIAPEIMIDPTAVYRILGSSAIRTAQDTIGNGEYFASRRLFEAGNFDTSMVWFQRFAARYPRNLLGNEALEHVLLIRQNREPGDQAMKMYAQVMALQDAGLADSAAATARTALERYPNAKLRHHFRYFLARAARDKRDHATAIQYALLVADSTSKSRLAPYALRLVGDETIAMGQDPAAALRVYQALLERYPDSPLAPPVRAQVIAIRKKLQL
jgi:TolA-binding protein